MKHKISELEGVWLDAAVAKAEGRMPSHGWVAPGQVCTDPPLLGQFEEYSSDWEAGGPIIERERITTVASTADDTNENAPIIWHAFIGAFSHYIDEHLWGSMNAAVECYVGDTALIAAMRVYVASVFGDEVELP